jgi:tRNA threonylcarbamoyladenosine biosynthesis protein TsaB
MIDARRMEVYYLIADSALNEIEPANPKIIKEGSFKQILDSREMIFFGNGLEECKPLLSKHSNAIFVDSVYPTAKTVGLLAFEKYKANEFEDIAYFEPYYLKEFLATKAKKLI